MARTCARGSRTSTPPCMIGAVIMKMMSNTNATSTSDVTLMSALSGSSPCPRRPPPPPPPRSPAIRSVLPGPASRRSPGQNLELAGEQPQAIDEDVVGHDRGNSDRQAADRSHQRFGDAGRDGGDVTRAADGDPDEGVHDTEHGAEQAEQRAHRAERRQPGKDSRGG